MQKRVKRKICSLCFPDTSVPKQSQYFGAVGEEGFYPRDSPNAKTINPGEEFAVTCGQDFVKNHSPASIDFAATHLWIGETCSSFSCELRITPETWHPTSHSWSVGGR